MIIYLIVILSLISDGVELYLIYLIAPVLSYINNYSEDFLSIITSVLFLGMAVGSLSSGLISKYLGRNNGILFFMVLISFFGTFCVSINNMYWFFVCRFIVGVSIGYLFNIVNTFTEILPIKYRDFVIGSVFFAIKLGTIYFIGVYYIFSEYFNVVEQYKNIVLISSLPMGICFIFAALYLDESPRILLWDCKYEEGFAVLDRLNAGSNYDFNDEEKQKVKNYIERTLDKEYSSLIKSERNSKRRENRKIGKTDNGDEECEEKSLGEKRQKILDHKRSWKNFSLIFKNKKLILTITLCALWSFNTITSFTNHYALPIILANQKSGKKGASKNLIPEVAFRNDINETMNSTIMKNSTNLKVQNSQSNTNHTLIDDHDHHVISINSSALIFNSTDKIQKIFIANVVPFPAEFLAGYLCLQGGYLGKKNIIFIGFFFMSIFSALMIAVPKYLYIWSSGINFFSVFAFNITKLYTSLAYSTDNRDFAYGLANFTSRVVCIMIPICSNIMLRISIFGTSYLILISSIIGCLVAMLLNEKNVNKPVK